MEGQFGLTATIKQLFIAHTGKGPSQKENTVVCAQPCMIFVPQSKHLIKFYQICSWKGRKQEILPVISWSAIKGEEADGVTQ